MLLSHMESTLAWLDFNAAERERTQRVLALFLEVALTGPLLPQTYSAGVFGRLAEKQLLQNSSSSCCSWRERRRGFSPRLD